MGFTPLGGVMMGTRTGDIDPAIIPYLMQHTDDFNTPEDISRILNRENIHFTGEAQLANEIFVDRIQKYIGQYLAVLNGADAIIFTAGIGENSVTIRRMVIEGISWFGCDVDPEKNFFGATGDISTEAAKVRVLVIPTDEELVIARDVERFKNQ